MGVYIKGMEMPKHCFNCSTKVDPDNRRCNIDGHVFEETLGKLTCRRDDACPLVSIPPHGRLIDADALHEELYALEYARENEWLDGIREARGVEAARVALLDAPTIIPAEPFNNLSKPRKDDDDIPICTKASPASLEIYKKAEEGE